VKDIRAAVAEAREHRELRNKPTILFLDEVHRFNKSQQDAFLPSSPRSRARAASRRADA
jgi:putative ATPase